MSLFKSGYMINDNGNEAEDINRLRSRHVHKYTKYKMCLSIMVAIGIEQQLSNIWSPIH